MATISTASIQDGQIIYAAHLLRVIQALDGNQAKTIIINGDFKQGALNNITDGTTSFSQGSGSIASGLYSHAEGRITNATGDYAHSEGYDNTASGPYSHTEGDNTSAGGFASHAEGTSTSTSGDYAHSEGDGTQANGDASHAEGEVTIATGFASHAEGYRTLADNDYSHAEGWNTVTLGQGSHAEGYFTTSSGDYSHAEGNNTIAYANYQLAVGQYNKDLNSSDYFVVGVGSFGARADGLGVNATRTYISNSLFLPNLTNTGQNRVATLDSNGKLYYAASESIKVTSASYSITASYALNAGALPGGSPNQIQYNNNNTSFDGVAGFNYINSSTLQYTGSFTISSSLNVIGVSKITGSLAVSGSGSSIVSIKGTTGPLLTVNDSNSGSLFTVNDLSGVSILDIRSDATITMGSSASPSLNTTKRTTTSAAQAYTLGGTLISTASYDGAFFEYVAYSASNARAGNVIAVWNGTTIVSSSTTTSDIGSTTGLTTFAAISGSYIVLSGSANAANWVIKSIIRAI